MGDLVYDNPERNSRQDSPIIYADQRIQVTLLETCSALICISRIPSGDTPDLQSHDNSTVSGILFVLEQVRAAGRILD